MESAARVVVVIIAEAVKLVVLAHRIALGQGQRPARIFLAPARMAVASIARVRRRDEGRSALATGLGPVTRVLSALGG